MTGKGRVRSVCMRVAVVVALVAIGSGLTGCYFGPDGFNPLVSGGDMPERAEVFAAAKANAYDFDTTLVTTKYGENHSQILMVGPIVQMVGEGDNPMREGWHIKKVEWTKLVWEKSGGKWIVMSGTRREPRWFDGTLN